MGVSPSSLTLAVTDALTEGGAITLKQPTYGGQLPWRTSGVGDGLFEQETNFVVLSHLKFWLP